MRIPPLHVILSWPTPNYVDPVTRGPALLIVSIIFATLVTVAVAGRFYTRTVVRRFFGLDDWFMIPAFIFSLALSVDICVANMRLGWDRHIWDVAPWMFQGANICAFVAKLVFTMASTFTRLSIICFYYRLVKDSGIRWFRWVLHASIAWTASVGISFVCLTIWLCRPVQCYWVYPPMVPCQCLSEGNVLVGGGVANSVTDALVTLLPIPIVMRLQLPIKQRVGICILLCFGVVVTIAGAVRTYYSWKALTSSYDETWWSYPLYLAATIEIDLAVICACAPAWKSLLHKHFANLSSKLSSPWFTSFRSSDKSRESISKSKTPLFNPLRSLHWFQLKTIHLNTARSVSPDDDDDEDADYDAVYASSSHKAPTATITALPPIDEREYAAAMADLYPLADRGMHLSRAADHELIVDEPVLDADDSEGDDEDGLARGRRPPTPALQIMMRQSFDMESSYESSPSHE